MELIAYVCVCVPYNPQAALRLPLSVPGALTRQAYELAVRLIAQQRSEGAASR